MANSAIYDNRNLYIKNKSNQAASTKQAPYPHENKAARAHGKRTRKPEPHREAAEIQTHHQRQPRMARMKHHRHDRRATSPSERQKENDRI